MAPVNGGIDWVTIQRALQRWVVNCTGLASDHVVWGDQNAPRQAQPGIVMRLSLINDGARPWNDHETNPLVFDDITFTANATSNAFTATAHGLLTGDGPVDLTSTLTIPTGAVSPCWIYKVDANTFKIADSFLNAMAGTSLDLTDAGTGVLTVSSRDNSLRAGQEIVIKSRAALRAMLTLECYAATGVGVDMASAILWRINAKRTLPTPAQILIDANIGIAEFGRVRSIGGAQDLVLFEPRAFVDILLNLVSEDSETYTIIERTEITDQIISDTFTVDGAE